MQRHHDMGGMPAGAIDRHEHELAPWEKPVDAILRLLLAEKVLTLDELRRAVEELGPTAYDQLSYFERWISAIANLLLEKGVVGVQELGEAIASAQGRRAAAVQA
jgi:Nitrile hydratase beta subunit